MLAASVIDSFARLSPTQMVLVAITIAALVVLLGSTKRRLHRSKRPAVPSLHETYLETEQDHSAARDIENVMMELDQLSREVHGRLDTKIAKLERLIRDADIRIAKLALTTHERGNRDSFDITVDDEPPVPGPQRALEEHERIHRLADEGCTPMQIAGKTGRLAGEVELILSLRRARQERALPTTVTA